MLYEKLNKEILHGDYVIDTRMTLEAYKTRGLSKSVFEMKDEETGCTLMHSLMGRFTKRQLDEQGLVYPERDDVEYTMVIIRHIIDVYGPDISLENVKGETMVGVIESGDMTPMSKVVLLETEKGKEFLKYLKLKMVNQKWGKGY